jgi:arsenate reductase-like glutaredoxin family protein
MATKEKAKQGKCTGPNLSLEIAELQKELLATVLKKTGIDYDFLIETAQKEFVASNLDVLNSKELKKFAKILL